MRRSHGAGQGGVNGERGTPLNGPPTVTLEVLHVRDCPHLAPMLERLQRLTDRQVTIREIATPEEAAAYGMAGSPTLLVDGLDPFADGRPDECGVSCRIYRDEQGRMVPVPTADQLRNAVGASLCSDGRRQPLTHPAESKSGARGCGIRDRSSQSL